MVFACNTKDGLRGPFTMELMYYVVGIAILLSNVSYSCVIVAYECWPTNDANRVINMRAIASILSLCGVSVIDKSSWYSDKCEPSNGFVQGNTGHLKNTPMNRDFLMDSMIDAET